MHSKYSQVTDRYIHACMCLYSAQKYMKDTCIIHTRYRQDTCKIHADSFMYVCVCINPRSTYTIQAWYRQNTVHSETHTCTMHILFFMYYIHKRMYVIHTRLYVVCICMYLWQHTARLVKTYYVCMCSKIHAHTDMHVPVAWVPLRAQGPGAQRAHGAVEEPQVRNSAHRLTEQKFEALCRCFPRCIQSSRLCIWLSRMRGRHGLTWR